jgi:hypothetical protein
MDVWERTRAKQAEERIKQVEELARDVTFD